MRKLFRNGQCWSAEREIFDGVLVENGFIIAIGEDALNSDHDEVIDLEGAFYPRHSWMDMPIQSLLDEKLLDRRSPGWARWQR